MTVALVESKKEATPSITKCPRDPSNYTILDPTTIKFKPRDEFISRLVGPLEATEVDLALALITRRTHVGTSFQDEFMRPAGTYDQLRQTQARLPKFSKWVTSLYPKRKELVEEFARLGQKVTSDVFEISGELIDILRCADTPHFTSCFAAKSYQNHIPKRVAEEAPGVCILFSDDAKGKMKARTWGVHVQDEKGTDALYLGARTYGVFDLAAIANQLHNKHGVDVYRTVPYGTKADKVKLTTINSFSDPIYFDFPIWGTVEGVKLTP